MGDIRVDVGDFEDKILRLAKDIPDIGREAVREGCRKAGRLIRNTVKFQVPILKPENAWLQWPDRLSSGRKRNRTVDGKKLPLVAGELRDSIYLTYSPKNSSIPSGRMTYLVGFPHSHGGGNIVKGWYGHFINNGHVVLNYPVNVSAAKARRLGIKAGTYPGKMGARISWVEGFDFIGKGYRRSRTFAEAIMVSAAKRVVRKMLAERGF